MLNNALWGGGQPLAPPTWFGPAPLASPFVYPTPDPATEPEAAAWTPPAPHPQPMPQPLAAPANNSGVPIGLLGTGLNAASKIASSSGFPDTGAALGGLRGLFNLGSGINTGNPGQIFGGLLGTANSAGTLFPEAASSLGNLVGFGSGAGAGLAAAEAGIGLGAGEAISEASSFSSAAGPITAGAALVVQALTEYLNNQEKINARNSGWWNNPIKGALYSDATAGTERALEILGQVDAAGQSAVPTETLLGLMGPITNGLLPHYATAQGGRGALRASDTVTGGSGPMSNQPYTGDGASPARYFGDFDRAQQGLTGLVQELLSRGVSYEQIGQAPGVNSAWVRQTMDMDPGYLDSFYRQRAGDYDAQAQKFLGDAGWETPITTGSGEFGPEVETGEMQRWVMGPDGPVPVMPGQWSPQTLFTAAQGSDPWMDGPQARAPGNITSMFGGPIWTALARMGVGGPEMTSLIGQHFNPWAGFQQDPSGIDNAAAMVLQQQLLSMPETYNEGGSL